MTAAPEKRVPSGPVRCKGVGRYVPGCGCSFCRSSEPPFPVRGGARLDVALPFGWSIRDGAWTWKERA